VERLPVDRVRAGQDSASTLVVGNGGSRRTTIQVRDAWQPTAGATRNRHRLRLAPGESLHIVPGMKHRMIAVEDCDVLEVSTPELDDVVRLEDRYGRADSAAKK